jgi:hypothetical protein
MYTTTTYFIKEQIPGATITELLHLYKEEMLSQHVPHLSITGNRLSFSNKNLSSVSNRHANKWASFTSGHISIEDTGDKYVVLLEGDISRTFIMVGIIAGIITLYLFINSAFDTSTLLVGIIVFAVLSGIMYGITAVSFPPYFKSIRNEIERRLQEGDGEDSDSH